MSEGFRAYPASYWDDESREWDKVIRLPTNPHQFYYAEADLLISRILDRRMRVLELGCGTGGSTRVHRKRVSRTVATDFSAGMVREAFRNLHSKSKAMAVDLAVVDAHALPFQPGIFDAIFSRGVLLSYVAKPDETLAEAHRVLRPGGRIALDAMNRLRPSRRSIDRGFRTFAGRPAYGEFFVRGGFQVRRFYRLSKDSPYTGACRNEERCDRRPRDLDRHVVGVETYGARLFRPRDLRALAQRAGFSDVRITPLGHMAHGLWVEDPELRAFVRKNRRYLARLALALEGQLRVEKALHLFLTGTRE